MGPTTVSINDSQIQKMFLFLIDTGSREWNAQYGCDITMKGVDSVRTPVFCCADYASLLHESGVGSFLTWWRAGEIEKKIKKNISLWYIQRMVLYSCHERICFSMEKTTESPAHREDGFYFEVFPLIVHYSSELLRLRERVSTAD